MTPCLFIRSHLRARHWFRRRARKCERLNVPAALGLSFIAILSLLPLLLESPPVRYLSAYALPWQDWGSKSAVLFVMLAIVVWRAWWDRSRESWSLALAVGLMGVAAVLTAYHSFRVDLQSQAAEWQLDTYRQILNHQMDAPHQYRPLPYGFVRTLEWLTGDWVFSCDAYRWFFTYWFLWAAYRFARLFHPPLLALGAPAAIAALYPLSVDMYWGQLTDPLSHSLFLLALIYVLEDQLMLLAAALALGVLAKETVVLVVAVYWACNWRGGLLAVGKAVLLGAVCTAAFLAARLPLGWWPGYQNINGTNGLMIWSNLGFPQAWITYEHDPLPNFLHPLMFVGTFLAFIAWHWRQLDGRLRTMFAVLTPLLLASNLCFGWMYESRNYMPLVPLLATMALPLRKGYSGS
jgi:hypothetical protein